jgi:hypothetical protein
MKYTIEFTLDNGTVIAAEKVVKNSKYLKNMEKALSKKNKIAIHITDTAKMGTVLIPLNKVVYFKATEVK